MTRQRSFWLWVAITSLCACDNSSRWGDAQNSSWEDVELGDGCGYVDPSVYVEIAVRAQRLEEKDSRRFLLSIKFTNTGSASTLVDDPRVLPSYWEPTSPTDPTFLDLYPPVVLRVGEIDPSGELAGEWTVLLPTPSAPAEPRSSTVAPGDSVEMSFVWVAPKSGRYALQGISGLFGQNTHRAMEPRCQGDPSSPLCSASSFSEFHFEVPAP